MDYNEIDTYKENMGNELDAALHALLDEVENAIVSEAFGADGEVADFADQLLKRIDDLL